MNWKEVLSYFGLTALPFAKEIPTESLHLLPSVEKNLAAARLLVDTHGIGGFCAMKALSTRNEAPEKASRPFERSRDGFVLAEGAGIVIVESWIDVAVLLPLALWQTVGAGYRLTAQDIAAGLILGLVCTALAYTMWTEGVGRIRVQHASILGYLEPVTAPVYALLLLGQGISGWTIAGGALIVAAGVLVLVWGERERRESAPAS